MSSPVEEFLIAIDQAWTQPSSAKTTLRVIGSTSLLLQTDYVRGTKDSDVLETIDMAPEVKQALLALAGEDTHHVLMAWPVLLRRSCICIRP